MADPLDLTFESTPDDERLVARLRASYSQMPPATAAQIERCTVLALEAAAAETNPEPATNSPRATPGLPHVRGLLPRPRWWWGVAAAATLVISVMRPWRGAETQRHADSAFTAGAAASEDASAANALPVGSIRDEGDGEIRFDLTLPTAASAVAIVGDFNGWDDTKTPMARRGTAGTWSVRVPLSPGRYSYAFVVDGRQWLVDTRAPQVPDAGFGPANAVVVDGTE